MFIPDPGTGSRIRATKHSIRITLRSEASKPISFGSRSEIGTLLDHTGTGTFYKKKSKLYKRQWKQSLSTILFCYLISVYLNNERAIREDALPIVDGQLSSLPLPHNAADGVASHWTGHRHRLTRHHLQPGLAIKNPPKKTPEKPQKWVFWFFLILNFL
jgi:hypothetical protein